MRVHVTLDHINAGKRTDPEACPIALALCEATGSQGWEVGDDLAHRHDYDDLDRCDHWHLPEVATRFVRDFDAGRPVRPFSFEAGEAS